MLHVAPNRSYRHLSWLPSHRQHKHHRRSQYSSRSANNGHRSHSKDNNFRRCHRSKGTARNRKDTMVNRKDTDMVSRLKVTHHSHLLKVTLGRCRTKVILSKGTHSSLLTTPRRHKVTFLDSHRRCSNFLLHRDFTHNPRDHPSLPLVVAPHRFRPLKSLTPHRIPAHGSYSTLPKSNTIKYFASL